MNALKNHVYLLKLVWRYAPIYILCELATASLAAISSVLANVFLLRSIINCVSQHTDGSILLQVILIYGLVIIFSETICAIYNDGIAEIEKEKLLNKLNKHMHERLTTVKMEEYESTSFYDTVAIAKTIATGGIIQIIDNIKTMIGELVNLIILVSFFSSIDIFILIIVFLATSSMLLLNSPIANRRFKRTQNLVPLLRKRQYFSNLFFSVRYKKDIMINNVEELLKCKLAKNHYSVLKIMRNDNLSIAILSFIQSFFSGFIFVHFTTMLYVGYKVIVQKSATVGDFVAVYNGVGTTVSALSFIVGTFLVKAKEYSFHIEKLRYFDSVSSRVICKKAVTKVGKIQELTCENICFSYPGTDNPTIKNVSMKIKKNMKVALVGKNGAGKSTLVKLLLGLYESYSGTILINGINIKEYSRDSICDMVGVVFQDYKLYATSVGENLSLHTDYDEALVDEALKKSDIHSSQKSMTCSTQLLREIDSKGLLLSGGEEQKIALARMYYKNPQIMILDEPTASLDPRAELDLVKTVLSSIQEKIVIIVSHRLLTTKHVDMIFVIDDGAIVEQGSHDELLKLGGQYHDMWNSQSKSFT